ncbi:MAG: hypothetical protein J5I90_11180 [Caldilineales bacterium]|nr:hypothetical protein [Caldilineales bacterium]
MLLLQFNSLAIQRLLSLSLPLGLALALIIARAGAVNAQGGSGISYPPETEVVRDNITILGTAQHPNFWKYEIAAAPTGTQNWFNIIVSETPVVNGVLGQWNTQTVGDGLYSLRLRVVRQDGNFDESFAQRVQVANSQPVATPTPEVSPTPTITPTNEPPTATPVVITPDIPTPTLSPVATVAATEDEPVAVADAEQETSSEDVLADLGNQATNGFVRGARAVLIVFIGVGVFFGIKSLLTWLYYRFLA